MSNLLVKRHKVILESKSNFSKFTYLCFADVKYASQVILCFWLFAQWLYVCDTLILFARFLDNTGPEQYISTSQDKLI